MLNAGSGKTIDTPTLRWIRQRPAAWSIFRRIPGRLQRPIVRRLRRPATELDLSWTDGMRGSVRERLGADVRRFLEAAGKPTDFWGEEFAS